MSRHAAPTARPARRVVDRPAELDAPASPRVHHTAVIDPTSQVAPDATVGPYAVVGPRCVIGPRCTLHAHSVICSDTTLGEGNEVFPHAVIGADPQDLKYRGEHAILVIGDNNKIREQVTIHRGTEVGGGTTRIGSGCLLMVGVHIAHDCVVEDDAVIANNVMLGGHAHIETGATIAGGAGVHHFATVGKYAFVGGLTRIAKDVPPFMVVEGNPAEPRKVNTVALSRRGFSAAEIEALKQAFKILFRDHEAPVSVLVQQLRADETQPPCVRELCDFFDRVRDGIHGRWRESLRDLKAAPRR